MDDVFSGAEISLIREGNTFVLAESIGRVIRIRRNPLTWQQIASYLLPSLWSRFAKREETYQVVDAAGDVRFTLYREASTGGAISLTLFTTTGAFAGSMATTAVMFHSLSPIRLTAMDGRVRGEITTRGLPAGLDVAGQAVLRLWPGTASTFDRRPEWTLTFDPSLDGEGRTLFALGFVGYLLAR